MKKMLEYSSYTYKKASWIELAVILFFSVYYILPSMRVSVNFMLPLMLAILYIGYLWLKDTTLSRAFIGVFISVVLVAAAYTLLTDTKTISDEGSSAGVKQFVSKFNQYLLMYLPALFFVRINKTANENQKKTLLAIMSALITYVIFETLRELEIDSNAIRRWEQFTDLEDGNIGNYYFVYAIPIIITIFSVCMQNVKFKGKVLCLAVIVFLFYFLVKAQYTLALLIAMLGVMLQIFLSIKNVAAKILFFVVSAVGLFFVPTFFLFIAENISSEQIAVRFRELYEFFGSGNADGYNLNGRLTLYRKTIIAFFKSPLWGTRSLDFDGHATYLTVLSDTGLIGAVPFYYMLFSVRKKIKNHLASSSGMFAVVFFCYLCMGFTNPIHSSMPLSWVVWFTAPLAIDTFFNKEEEAV